MTSAVPGTFLIHRKTEQMRCRAGLGRTRGVFVLGVSIGSLALPVGRDGDDASPPRPRRCPRVAHEVAKRAETSLNLMRFATARSQLFLAIIFKVQRFFRDLGSQFDSLYPHQERSGFFQVVFVLVVREIVIIR